MCLTITRRKGKIKKESKKQPKHHRGGSIWGDSILVGLERKYLSSTIFFFLSLLPPIKHPQNLFSPIFFFFILPKIYQIKRTLKVLV